MTITRKGDYIETFSGIKFWPLDPKPEEIVIRDIAHSLSLVCRFTGHCKFFYSVAQHSIHTSNILRQLGLSPKAQLRGLLHDASEAYLCDIAAPVKPHLPGYRELESILEDVVYKKYELDDTSSAEIDWVKQIDMVMVRLEGETLVRNSREWNIPYPEPRQTLEEWNVQIPEITYAPHRLVELEFLYLFEKLIREIAND